LHDKLSDEPFDRATGQESGPGESLLQKYGKDQLQALVAQNDEMAIGASSAIQAANRLGEFKVLIGVDGSKPALDAVTAGTLTATVFQDAVGQGTQAVVAAQKILAGEAVEPQLLIPFKLVTKENVSSFRRARNPRYPRSQATSASANGAICHHARKEIEGRFQTLPGRIYWTPVSSGALRGASSRWGDFRR